MAKCDICGNEFRAAKRGNRIQKRCSKACYEIARLRRTDKKYVGKKFGMLTVIERDTSDLRTKYICSCECGNEVSVRAGHLTAKDSRDKTVSCGCHRQKISRQMAKKNIAIQTRLKIGAKYGRLAITGFSHVGPDGATWHNCQCECGTARTVRTASLVSGSTKSCGCLHREVAAENLRQARFKHGLSNERAYLNWQKRQRYKDAQQWTYQMEAALFNLYPNCIVCGSNSDLCVDHVFPFSKGGELIPGNVVILCRGCNSFKFDKLLSDLPSEMADKISNAAYEFKKYWQQVKPVMVS